MKKIVIIGGGAAGMMAAAGLAEMGHGEKVILLESNDVLGRKVAISGGGRCNVTTGLSDIKKVLSNYPRGANFLRHAMYEFSPNAMCEWLENHGIPLKTEKDNRVFPKSNKGEDVVKVFEKTLVESGVEIRYQSTVKSIQKGFVVSLEDGEKIKAESAVITTGGQAYRETGSLGDGYGFAESLGHTITPLAPSLSAFTVKDDWVKKLAGLSFSEVRLRLSGANRYEFSGPILFTHKGITGPAVFALSSLAAYEILTPDNPTRLAIDFSPNESYEALTQKLVEAMQTAPQKRLSNTLGKFVYKSMGPTLCALADISENRTNAEVGKKGLARVVECLKNTTLTVNGRLPGEEFVTAGGVTLTEVNPKTMGSLICPGLYFAGEILNIDGFTGGYNLQAAWCTGRFVGLCTCTDFE